MNPSASGEYTVRLPFSSSTQTRRRLRNLRNGPRVDEARYRRIVREEELRWFISISIILLLPLAVMLLVMAFDRELGAMLSDMF